MLLLFYRNFWMGFYSLLCVVLCCYRFLFHLFFCFHYSENYAKNKYVGIHSIADYRVNILGQSLVYDLFLNKNTILWVAFIDHEILYQKHSKIIMWKRKTFKWKIGSTWIFLLFSCYARLFDCLITITAISFTKSFVSL